MGNEHLGSGIMNVCTKHAATAGLVLAAFLLSGCQSQHPQSGKRARSVPAEAIVGEWGGFSGEHDYYLMNLRQDGSGLLGYMPHQGTATLLRISSWKHAGDHLIVVLAPIGENPKAVQRVEGSPGWLNMSLIVSGQGWHRRVDFHREDDHEARKAAIKAVIDGLPK